MSDEHRPYDAIIIGGGPAGLSAAMILGRCRRRVLLIDSGQPRNAKSHGVNGFLGHDGIPPFELREIGQREIAKYGIQPVDDVVEAAEPADLDNPHFQTGFRVTTRGSRSETSRKVLFATGTCDELPDFDGVNECYGKTVHHCPYCDGWEHRDQRLAAYGETIEGAVGLALALRMWSDDVTALANGHELSGDQQERLSRNGVRVAKQRIVRLVHEGPQLRGIEFEASGLLPAEALFFDQPQRSSCNVPRSLGVECDGPFSGRTDRRQKTNVPGVFVAGDADGDVQFAIAAAAEGAIAAVAINRELQDEDQC
jgi:thioredoxin reductase